MAIVHATGHNWQAASVRYQHCRASCRPPRPSDLRFRRIIDRHPIADPATVENGLKNGVVQTNGLGKVRDGHHPAGRFGAFPTHLSLDSTARIVSKTYTER
jgi:hypothetical protein